jgi:small subunit ribosomal protein S8
VGKFLVLKKLVGKPMLTDPISDMLTRIRNASKVKRAHVDVPVSKIKFAIAKILENEGFVEKVTQIQDGNFSVMRIELKYNANQPAITEINRVSKPGRRIYAKVDELKVVRSGLGVSILSTPNGLMTNNEARKRRLGGEVICEVF